MSRPELVLAAAPTVVLAAHVLEQDAYAREANRRLRSIMGNAIDETCCSVVLAAYLYSPVIWSDYFRDKEHDAER